MTNIFIPTNNWLHMMVYICTTTPSLNFKNLNFTCAPTSVSRSASHRKLVRLPQGPAPTTPDQDSPATPAPSAQVLLRPPRPLHGRTGKLNEEEDETSHLFWRRSDQVLVVLVPCHSLWINSRWPSKTLFFNGKQCILMISGSKITLLQTR